MQLTSYFLKGNRIICNQALAINNEKFKFNGVSIMQVANNITNTQMIESDRTTRNGYGVLAATLGILAGMIGGYIVNKEVYKSEDIRSAVWIGGAVGLVSAVIAFCLYDRVRNCCYSMSQCLTSQGSTIRNDYAQIDNDDIRNSLINNNDAM